MRPAIRTTAAAAAIAAALALGAAPAAASRWSEEGVTTRIAQRIENQGFLGFLWSTLRSVWGQDSGSIPPGGTP